MEALTPIEPVNPARKFEKEESKQEFSENKNKTKNNFSENTEDAISSIEDRIKKLNKDGKIYG